MTSDSDRRLGVRRRIFFLPRRSPFHDATCSPNFIRTNPRHVAYHARQTADTSRNECSAVGSAIQYGMLMACPAATMTAISTIVHHKHSADQMCFVYKKAIFGEKKTFRKKQDWSLWSYLRDTRCFIWPRHYAQWGFQKPGALLKYRFRVSKTKTRVSGSSVAVRVVPVKNVSTSNWSVSKPIWS